MRKMLKSVDDVVAAFGGPAKLAAWASLGVTAIHNWIARQEIPPSWQMQIAIELKSRNLVADPKLFGLEGDHAKTYTKLFKCAAEGTSQSA